MFVMIIKRQRYDYVSYFIHFILNYMTLCMKVSDDQKFLCRKEIYGFKSCLVLQSIPYGYHLYCVQLAMQLIRIQMLDRIFYRIRFKCYPFLLVYQKVEKVNHEIAFLSMAYKMLRNIFLRKKNMQHITFDTCIKQ